MKLLLHTCCAPCSVYCIEQLRNENIEPTLFWYNPNIHPFTEYQKRRDTLVDYASSIGAKAVIEDEYGLDEFCKNTANNPENRCTAYCYPVRMRKTFEYAKANGFDAVSTTLLYSIYQDHYFIVALCKKLSDEFGIDFLYRDFRVGFWEGHDKAIEAGLYMQKYCGCIFSEEDRFVKDKQVKPTLPEGFEFNKRIPVEMKKSVKNGCDVYSLVKGDDTICQAVFEPIDSKKILLKSLETKPEYAEKGFEERLLKSASANYKQKYTHILVLSFAKRIPFFVKLGFDRFEGINNDKGLICYSKQL